MNQRTFLITLLFLFSPLLSSAQAFNSNQCDRRTKSSLVRHIQDLKASLTGAGRIESGFAFQVVENEFQSVLARAAEEGNADSVLWLNPNKKGHEIWGYGGNITDSCLAHLDNLSDKQRNHFMNTFFSREKGAGLSYLRVPIGANDFSDGDYTLDDTPGNVPDPRFKYMNFKKLDRLLEFVQTAKKLNPDLRIMITPWTPPAWMKTIKTLKGGLLEKKYFDAYATYLVKAAKHIEAKGLKIHSLSIMNEPLIDAWNGWMFPQAAMSVPDQVDFTKNYLAPKLRAARLDILIMAHDHNASNSSETIQAIQRDRKFRESIGGVAHHCYYSSHEQFIGATRNVFGLPSFNTECTATQNDLFARGDFQWWMHRQSLDAVRDGGAGALGWNLCLDETGGPSNGGCKGCRGLATILSRKRTSEKGFMKLNPELYALWQTSRYLKPGAVTIENLIENNLGLEALTALNPDGRIIVIVRNPTETSLQLRIRNEASCDLGVVQIPAYGAGSYVVSNP